LSPINTSKVQRRKLWFHSIEELLQELDRIEAAEKSGTLKALGNWTPGQILSHVSAWIEYGWDGYPIGAPPFFIKWLLKLMVRRQLRKGMPAGIKIPGIDGGTKGQELMPTDAAIARLRKALHRLQNGELAVHDSPAFGPMSHEDRILLNLRHAELHLSFLQLN
jgi:hypothetical protein